MQVFFRPRFDPMLVPPPESWRTGHEQLIDRWREALGLKSEDLVFGADPEDWTENAVQLIAALDSGLPVHVIRRGPGIAFTRHAGTAAPDPALKTILIGTVAQHDPFLQPGAHVPGRLVWPDAASIAAARRYWTQPAFLEAAGRKTAVADIPDGEVIRAGDPGALPQVCLGFRPDSGRKDLFLKVIAADKYAVAPMTVEAGDSLERVESKLVEALDYTLVHLEGQRGAILVQEHIPMRMEYRTIVVDGRPVAGAGCIEHLSPLDRIRGSFDFDPQVEETRGSGKVLQSPDVVARYRRDAERLARAFARHDPTMRDYTLDLATGRDENTVVVETNPLKNYGLYAMRYERVFKAIVAAAAQRDHHTERAQTVPSVRPPPRKAAELGG